MGVAAAPSTRHVTPLGEWTYVKLYCGKTSADRVLLEHIEPLLTSLGSSGSMDWFFVRYADPFEHLRVRLRRDERRLDWTEAILRWCEDLKAKGVIDRYALDTYVRELERYGGPLHFDVVERAFVESSDASVADLRGLRKDLDERIVRTIVRLDEYLMRRIPPLVVAGLLESLHPTVRKLPRGAWDAIRRIRRDLKSARALPTAPGAVDALAAADARGKLGRSLVEVARSLIHMHCNRMGIAAGDEERSVMDVLWHAYHGMERQAGSTELALAESRV